MVFYFHFLWFSEKNNQEGLIQKRNHWIEIDGGNKFKETTILSSYIHIPTEKYPGINQVWTNRGYKCTLLKIAVILETAVWQFQSCSTLDHCKQPLKIPRHVTKLVRNRKNVKFCNTLSDTLDLWMSADLLCYKYNLLCWKVIQLGKHTCRELFSTILHYHAFFRRSKQCDINLLAVIDMEDLQNKTYLEQKKNPLVYWDLPLCSNFYTTYDQLTKCRVTKNIAFSNHRVLGRIYSLRMLETN